MTIHTLALKSAPVFIALALPLAIVSCSSEDTPSNQNNAGTGGGTSMGGSGGSSGSAAGQTAKGGSSGTAATMGGSSGTGGSTGGAGTTGKGGAGAGGAATGGSAGKGMAGGGGMPAGGAGAGGAGAAGMGGASGGMAGSTGGGMAGATGAGAGGAAGGGGGAFTLTSPDHAEGAKFDAKFTCAAMNGTFGSGVNPELVWSGVPAGTKSLAMTFIDTTLGEDNQLGQHWAIWNIPWDGTKIATMPEGLGQTLMGDLAAAKQSGKFLTPCAQSLMGGMDDQYRFKLYALSTETLAITGTSVANALTALRAAEDGDQVLGTAELTGHAGLKGQ